MNFIKIVFCIFLFALINGQESLKVMTYNIKLDYPKEGENRWSHRKHFMQEQILFHHPTIIGVQEALPNQMADLNNILEDYDFVGVGRDDGKNEGEFSALFYDKNRVKLKSSGTFWLSETPNIVSRGWDAACNRVCTWAHFTDVKTKEDFWVFNTHLDHVGTEARKNSVLLLLSMIEKTAKNSHIILTGDFNMTPEDPSLRPIQNQLLDSRNSSPIQMGPEATFNAFEFCNTPQKRIDYIFVSHGINVKKYGVLSDHWEQHYPSDHFPVMVELEL